MIIVQPEFMILPEIHSYSTFMVHNFTVNSWLLQLLIHDFAKNS